MVRLPLSAFLMATAALDAAGREGDLPLVITGCGVAAALLVTLALDVFWFDRGGGKAPRVP
ncbi:MAG TPA: hypothetical protein VMA53_14970 [Stellaceae bacterium]|nr:hypothetical protein [Stellaceae bacterium]